MRWAACSAAAPATARSSPPCMRRRRWPAMPSPGSPHRAGRRSARVARARRRCQGRPAAKSSAPTAFRPMRLARAGHPLAPSSRPLHLRRPRRLRPSRVRASSRVFTAADCRAQLLRRHPAFRRPAGACREVARFRGEAVALVAGEPRGDADLDLGGFPGHLERAAAIADDPSEALAPDAAADPCRAGRGNVLSRAASRAAMSTRRLGQRRCRRRGRFETGFVEHAYIEPEAGFARRVGDRSRSRPARRRPIWTATTSPRILGSRPRRCASSRPRSAAASAPSSTCRCSPSSALAAWTRPAGAHGLHARRIR